MVKKDVLIEVCIDSIQSGIAAQKGGARRIELCANLDAGGTTPSAAIIQLACRYLDIDINVIIRPRAGDFCYSNLEFEVMKRNIQIVKEMGVNGIVVGILTLDGEVDVKRMKELINIAKPLSITFHRAFDMTKDPFKALEVLIDLGVDRILTSGQRKSALEGLDLISELANKAGEELIIMPGSGINAENVDRILAIPYIRELHLSGRKKVDSVMKYRNSSVTMGGDNKISEYENYYTDENIIRAVQNKCKLTCCASK